MRISDWSSDVCSSDLTTMLLGAAKYLAETRNFDGTVHFIFQPAEEGLGGGDKMVQEGMFERFACDTVWGMHNIPGIPVGNFAETEEHTSELQSLMRISYAVFCLKKKQNIVTSP